jgi:rhomboid protease GluP
MGNTRRAILCPNCRKLISADAEQCIHCDMKNPGRFGLHTVFQKLFRSDIGFIQAVSCFCIGLYLVSILIDPRAILRSRGLFNFLSPSGESLYILGMTGKYAISSGRWWTLITAIYLHGGILHILFNLLWIRQLGPMVEGFYGSARFIVIFTISGIFGFVLSFLTGTAFTVGASGAIFGLLGALIYYGRSRGGVFKEIIYPQILTWAVVLFLFGFVYPSIDNFAHLGGFVGGYLSGNLLGYDERQAEKSRHKTLAAIAIVLTILAFVVNFAVLLL